MEQFSNTINLIKIRGRIAKECMINFGNIQAARFVIDHITQYGAQLNLNIKPECLSNPSCAENVISYVGLTLITMGVIRVVEEITWRRITKGRDGSKRYHGKYSRKQ